LWREENGAQLQPPADAGAELRSAGISPGGMSADMSGQAAEAPEDMAAEADPAAAGGEEAAAAPAQ